MAYKGRMTSVEREESLAKHIRSHIYCLLGMMAVNCNVSESELELITKTSCELLKALDSVIEGDNNEF